MTSKQQLLQKVTAQILSGEPLEPAQAYELAYLDVEDFSRLLLAASQVRMAHFGSSANLCAIINAKSGLCPEDCSFCAQSSHYKTGASVYPLLNEGEILSAAHKAADDGAACFGIVSSGTGIDTGRELDQLCRVTEKIRDVGAIAPAVSLGTLTESAAMRLKEAGLVTYHHNLETSRSFFPNVCSTHAYDEDVETVRLAKRFGFRVCCGGLFGLGETMEQRVELAMTLRELEVDSVPINFLDPVAGTPMADMPVLSPRECLHTLALFRLILPTAHITVCGGRQRNLKELQPLLVVAGASGLMTGNYLTKAGRNPELDRAMLEEQGIIITKELLK